MLLSEIKSFLGQRDQFTISLPDGSKVPSHFHVTEVGEVSKTFIDCGGTLRRERRANFQLWNADDYDHRLAPGKLVHIIELAEKTLGMADLEIEVEYQGDDSIIKYDMEVRNGELYLASKQTACLALDACGIEKPKVSLSNFVASSDKGSCTPGGGCC